MSETTDVEPVEPKEEGMLREGEHDLVHRSKRRRVKDPAALTQVEQNALMHDMGAMEAFVTRLHQACVLMRQKDQLERQVDALSRQVHDLRTQAAREQDRLNESRATRMAHIG